jgi:uncharacterized OB-fold protein
VTQLSVERGSTWERPFPAPDPVSSEFWSTAFGGRLLIQHCPACGERQFYPRAVCMSCGSKPDWEEVSGRGTVHTFTIIRQNYARPFRDELPYVVAIIELAEGPRMMGNVTGVAADDVYVGMEVAAYIIEAEEGVGVPMWRPARAGG